MKNYRNIKRLFEQDQTMAPEMPMTHSTEPHTPLPMPAEAPTPLPLPGEMQSAADPMVMTVRDFVAKCKNIDPLVCMGIESFIEKNKAAFGGETAAPAEPAEPAQDLTFSQAISPEQTPAPAPAEPFSLDQSPESLNFPG